MAVEKYIDNRDNKDLLELVHLALDGTVDNGATSVEVGAGYLQHVYELLVAYAYTYEGFVPACIKSTEEVQVLQ